MATVSIIIPTFKGENNILTAVISALKQRGDNVVIEIIVVDDNGNGTEHQIATEKKLRNLIDANEIQYLKHECNINGSAARNTGYRASAGEYIVFLDDDDYLFPDKICKQITQLESLGKEYGVSVSAGFYVHKDGKGYTRKIKYEEEFLYHYLLDKNYFNTSALVLRRSAIDAINGFDESFRRHQDWEFCSRLLCITKPCYINEPLFIKYAENRNVPSNLEIRAEQLDFYFNKIEIYWKKTLDSKQIIKVKRFRYRQIFYDYIFSKKLSKGCEFLRLHGCRNIDPIYAMVELFVFAIRRLTIGNRKITYSYNEIQKLLGIEEKNDNRN